ncbi:MAG: nitroreductase [Proteobacteria bacterium]|nr:nitroreductase [Pseudomonadota bacterium]
MTTFDLPSGVPAAAPVLDQLLSQRFSCRSFRPDPVPQATLDQIVALAQRTASWCNTQPWQVHITRGEATERFRQILQAPSFPGDEEGGAQDFPWPVAYEGVYQQRRRESGLALYDSVGIAKGDREASARQAWENFRLFGAPHVVMITTDEALGVYGAIDCGGYVANFMLAATSLGVNCIAQAALAKRPERVRAFFDLPSTRRVVCGISLGYADPAHPANGFRTNRADVAAAVSWHD